MTGAAISLDAQHQVRLDVVVQTTPSAKDVYSHEHTKDRHQHNIETHHNLRNELTIRVERRELKETAINRDDR